MRKLILLTFALSTIFLGCNPKLNSNNDSAKPQTFNAHQELVATGGDFFSYQYLEDGCDTGRHEFSDHVELCKALLDGPLNHWCAPRLRLDYYEQECR